MNNHINETDFQYIVRILAESYKVDEEKIREQLSNKIHADINTMKIIVGPVLSKDDLDDICVSIRFANVINNEK